MVFAFIIHAYGNAHAKYIPGTQYYTAFKKTCILNGFYIYHRTMICLYIYVIPYLSLQRKETLLVEYKNRGKVNKFVDRRFGENDPEMSVEDKMLQRFALERQVGLNIT